MGPIDREDYTHDLERGDHVVRWTNILVWPYQVHGIVLSAGQDIVTIVDCGLSAAKSRKEKKKDEPINLEEIVDHEDKVMMEACEAHRNEHVGADRINILTLIEEKEIKQWKKVNYGESLKKDWRWWKKGTGTNSISEKKKSIEEEQEEPKKEPKKASDEGTEDDDLIEIPDEKELQPKKQSAGLWGCKSDKHEQEAAASTTEESKVPKLPKSDPAYIVLRRVRYLLNNPQELPPHHILFANSECIAVWCKTGRWSTIQASIFLYSSAVGNFKTAVLTSTGVAAATTTTMITVPAGGIAGWFGMTTTTTATVSLLSVQPWLIPVLAGYGLVAVGTPMMLAHTARKKWESATRQLNDGFWSNAESDVYVEAIKSWSELG